MRCGGKQVFLIEDELFITFPLFYLGKEFQSLFICCFFNVKLVANIQVVD